MKTTLMSQVAECPRHRFGWIARASFGAMAAGLRLMFMTREAAGIQTGRRPGSAGRGGSND